ncbi:hypothetical protein BOTCAL_0059g00350 [Botryotinia calthae]|uniref:Uncharacterized protein n=1 Tax=Botryotinia calthae TaxID=38488 RepID=A0A4Y8DA78_9HELO|nr:hypothetical protein BOTCAL_0059g00350 [Botryotinia calthae]
MEARHDPEGRRVLKIIINSLEYFYDGEHVTCFGHNFMEIYLGDDNRSDIEALKQRLANSNTDEPDIVVEQGIQKLMRAHRKKDRQNEEPVHQAQQARHEEEVKDSDQDSVKDNDEGEDDSEECDDDADNSDEELTDRELTDRELTDRELTDEELTDEELTEKELTEKELTDRELTDRELTDRELSDDELDDERVYLGMWATTGHWELKCKTMSSNYGQSEPYTLDIFSVVCTNGFQVFGRFNLGKFKGIIRFARGGNSADRNEYIFDQAYDVWTADMDTTRIYRWRGKDCQDIIQLGSDSYAYTMTFSRAGTRVNGVWGTCDGDPGTVEFTGEKISEEDTFARDGILQEWMDHN